MTILGTESSDAVVTDPVEILLVEDNPGDVRLTQEALRYARMPNHLSVVRDGEEAIEFLNRRGGYAEAPRPQLILLDLNLPRKSGAQVLEEIKAAPSLRSIPVIILTTSHADDDINDAYDMNANCYISKPVDLDRFLRVIKSIDEFWFSVVLLPRMEIQDGE